MTTQNQLPTTYIAPLLMATSLLVGWFIPDFYDWSGADQSRPAPVIGWTALGMLVTSIGIWIALPWIPFRPHPRQDAPIVLTRFTLRTLAGITAVAAVVSAGIMTFPLLTGYAVWGLVWVFAVWGWTRDRLPRLPALALLACMHFPFAWVIRGGLPDIEDGLVALVAGLPGFFITLFAGRFLIGQHIQELAWLAILISASELAVGLWISRLGPKRGIAYCVLVLLISVYGSFTLNMLVRI